MKGEGGDMSHGGSGTATTTPGASEWRGHAARGSGDAERKGQQPQRRTYIPVRLLGEGTFGVVIQAKVQETGEDVAIKRVRYDARLHNRELIIMRDILSANAAPARSGSSSKKSQQSGSLNGSRTGETQDKARRTNSSSNCSGASALAASSVDETRSQTSSQRSSGSEGRLRATAGSQRSDKKKQTTPPPSQTPPPPAFLPFHPNVVQLLGHYFSTERESGEYFLHLVMSYLPMDLQAAKRRCWAALNLGPTPARAEAEMLLWARVILFQLARALTFLHARRVCHRDVKPGNILFDPDTGRVQLGDFGSAKQLHHTEKNVSYICSRYYRAPELLFGALYYGCEVDLWSLGCIAAELLRPRGETLFKGATTVDQMAEIFKVLGAPSTEEMYAMNPQCAEAMLYTDRLYYPPGSDRGGVHGTMGAAQAGPGNVMSAAAAATATGGPGIAGDLPSPPSRNTALPPHVPSRDRLHRYDAEDDTAAHDALDLPLSEQDYFDYYRVLKIRAMRWKDVLARNAPSDGVDLVTRLLCYVPGKRLSAAGVVEHAFFQPLFSCGAREEPTSGSDTVGGDGGGGSATTAASPVRLPNGRLLPAEMFTLTEAESHIYSLGFQMKMAREAERIRAAAAADKARA